MFVASFLALQSSRKGNLLRKHRTPVTIKSFIEDYIDYHIPSATYIRVILTWLVRRSTKLLQCVPNREKSGSYEPDTPGK